MSEKTVDTQVIGVGWGANWPETITLGDAADQMNFDLFQGDDEELLLVKVEVNAADHYSYTTHELDENDAEDRTDRIMGGLHNCPENVPPIVALDGGGSRVAFEGLRDGHHRVAIAHEAGRPTVPAYKPQSVA